MTQNTYLVDKELIVVDDGRTPPDDEELHLNLDYPKPELHSHKWRNNSSFCFKILATTSPSLESVDKFDWPGEVVDTIDWEKATKWASGMIMDFANVTKDVKEKAERQTVANILATFKSRLLVKWTDNDMKEAWETGMVWDRNIGKEITDQEFKQFLSSLRPIPTYIEFQEQKVNGKLIVKTVKY